MADLPNVHHEQIAEFKHIATSNNDTSVLMLNLNRYTEYRDLAFRFSIK